jgi:hypothetical protein
MSMNEILAELDSLSSSDLQVIQEKLDRLRTVEDTEETPEMLAAIDEGLRSGREEGHCTIEALREDMRSWNSGSK